MKTSLLKIKYFFRNPLQFPIVIITKLSSYFKFIYETRDYQGYVNFEFWLRQRLSPLGENRKAYWPVHPTSEVYDVHNIEVGVDAYPGIMGGCYITGKGGLRIGDYTQIAPNVVIVTANHDQYDLRKSITSPVEIGKYCWIGAGVKIMPGVVLGDWTIVGAGAVVTKSFAEGHCVIAGVPAKKIKDLDINKCIPYENKIRYRGYIREDKFHIYRKKYLYV
jgi:acetyltransferase-like isoleucine patch superfamily enzyme